MNSPSQNSSQSNIAIRPFQEADIDALYQMLLRKEFHGMQYPPGKEESYKSYFQLVLEWQKKVPTKLQIAQWIIWDQAELLGNVIMTHRRGHSMTGWNLRPESWGQGIMPSVLKTIFQSYFETCPDRKIVADVFTDNHRSQRVIQKLGFQQTKIPRFERLIHWLKKSGQKPLYRFQLDQKQFSTAIHLHPPKHNCVLEGENWQPFRER